MARYGKPSPYTGSPAPTPSPQPPSPRLPGETPAIPGKRSARAGQTVPPFVMDGDHDLFIFDSVHHLDQMTGTRPMFEAGNASRREGKRDWAGTYDWDEALALAERGWPEGVAKAHAISEKLLDRLPEAPRLSPSWDVAPGQYFDVARILEGEPECWASPATKRGTPYRILVNLTASAGVKGPELMRRGAHLIALAQALQARGESVEIWAGMSQGQEYNSHAGRTNELLVQLAEAGAPVSQDTLAYWLGHPSAFRRHMFSAIEHTWPEASHAGYGFPVDFLLAKSAHLPKWDLVVEHADGSGFGAWSNDDRAFEWLSTQLAKLTEDSHV